MHNAAERWRRFERDRLGAIALNRPERLAALEQFREALVAVCGQEPTILMTHQAASSAAAPEIAEVSLTDYAGWILKTQQAAIYRWDNESFHRVASLGPAPIQISAASLLPHWLSEHGVLVRSKLNLAGLSAQEAETFLAELDMLQTALVAPILVNDTLWGFMMIGPPLAGEYDDSETLYLTLFGLSIVSAMERHRRGLPTYAQTLASVESKTLRDLEQLWISLRPTHRRLKLLIQDEEVEVVATLSSFFTSWGFEVISRRSGRMRPDLVLRPFPKPCRFARLAQEVFEDALTIAVGGQPLRVHHGLESCLIVEEEAEVALALKEYFTTKGGQAWIAASAEETVALVGRLHPRVVLLNLPLPEFKDAELIRQIRKISPQSRIILLTEWAEAEYPHSMLKSTPPDAYCVKPVRLEELEQLVEGVEPAAVS